MARKLFILSRKRCEYVSSTSGISNLFEVGLVFAVLCFIGTFFLPERALQGDEYYSDSGE